MPRRTPPTAPVAPTTAILGTGLLQLERLVQRDDRALEVGIGDVAGDLDRRRRDHLRLDAQLVERRERLRRNARVPLHPPSDARALPEVFARRPAAAEPVEHGGGIGMVAVRLREDDLAPGLE